MKRLLRLLCLWSVLVLPAVVRAQVQAQFGDVCLALDAYTAKTLADPGRDRVYAIFLQEGSVGVIDTTTLSVIAKVPYTGLAQDLAISPDGDTLYVVEGYHVPPPPTANSAQNFARPAHPEAFTTSTVEAIDLNTLKVVGSTPLADPGMSIAAGFNGRLYVTTVSSSGVYSVFQIDRATGAVQATLERYISNPRLRTTPDHRTLLVAEYDNDPSRLLKYDVSTASPALLQSVLAGDNAQSLSISHNGQFLCVPCYAGNDGKNSTALFSVADLRTTYGKFFNDAQPGPVAFSPDDSLVYQARNWLKPELQVFSTSTFTRVNTKELPDLTGGSQQMIYDVVSDHTGSYLFVAEGSIFGSFASTLAVIATGTGPLKPPALLPTIIVGGRLQVAAGDKFSYQINATNQPTAYGATQLPVGLKLDPRTGLISGTVDIGEYGTHEVQLSASNAAGIVYQTLYLRVVGVDDYPPVVMSANTATANLGAPFSFQITGSHRPDTYTATALPAGLALNTSSGLISGVPAVVGTYVVTVGVSNYYGSGTATLVLTITGQAPVITSANATTAYLEDDDFSYRIVATNRPTGYAATGLPPGLSVSQQRGSINGVPTQTGIFPVTISATNPAGTGSATLTLTVLSGKPVIAEMGAVQAQVGVPFSYQVPVSNQPTSISASELPEGLDINQDGLISGTPQKAGTFTVRVFASNFHGDAFARLTLVVAPVPVKLPKINVMATTPRVVAGSGGKGVLTLSRDGEATETLVVKYTLKGSAKNGKDYAQIKGTKKIKAGKTSVKIKVVPLGDLAGSKTKTLKFMLTTDPSYELGETATAKVKILPAGQ